MSLSTATASPTKKRKHVDSTTATDDASRKKAKKDKKDKKEKKDKSKKRDKGKARDDSASSEFKLVNASLVVSIPPVFASKPLDGVEEMLDSLIMRYVPALNGVLICHTNTRFLSQTATIKNECPFAVCSVGFDATVWSPQIGTKLKGKVNLCSPDHISLLVHKTFNVSIPRHHIPTDSWEFEYGPAENDPEYSAGAGEGNGMEIDGDGANETEEVDAGGKWIHRVTADVLAEKERVLEFTVIGLTVANDMLSLVGSLQADPFSTEHVATAGDTTSRQPRASSSQQKPSEPSQAALPEVPAVLDESDIDDDDPFKALGRTADEAAAREAAKKLKEADAKAEKKRLKKLKKEAELAAEAPTGSGQGEQSETAPKRKKKKKSNE